MSEEIEIELLHERVDALRVANEELRERLKDARREIIEIVERSAKLEKDKRELATQIGRLQLHLQQGVEL